MEIAFPGLNKGKSELSGTAISTALLKFFFDIVFSEESWSTLTAHEQETVKHALAPWEENPRFDIDLFKGPRWKLL